MCLIENVNVGRELPPRDLEDFDNAASAHCRGKRSFLAFTIFRIS